MHVPVRAEVHALELKRPSLASSSASTCRDAEQAERAEVGGVRVGKDEEDAEQLQWIDNPMHTALRNRTRGELLFTAAFTPCCACVLCS